eukprot:TRINITY_DN219_c0_g1_i1.p1 TRINITY_DN219_c0_g1~~TRINITY_DN219_c0_g1_i1.p1  ORF type:complete len:733 (-),score=136.76 TRINITY_DN219_c0_g1_i1:483-2681(-)
MLEDPMRSSSSSSGGNGSKKVLQAALRILLLILALMLGYFLGRPIYWTVGDGRVDLARNSGWGGGEGGSSPSKGGTFSSSQTLPGGGSSVPQDPEQEKLMEAVTRKRKDRLDQAHAAVAAAKNAAAVAVEEVVKEEGIADERSTSGAGTSASQGGTSGEQSGATAVDFGKGVRSIIHEGRPLSPSLKHDIWEQPTDPAIPPKEEFALRREMVQFRAKENVIVVTFANFAFMDFALNWVRHLTDVGVFNILVGAMDTKILEGLYLEGVPVFDMESGMSTVDVGWGTPIFHKMGREKITLINVFLSMGVELLMCDTDMVWLQNPLPWLRRWPNADVVTSTDEVVRTVDDDGLERWDRAHAAYNIGILYYRPRDPAKRQAREWAELLSSDDKIWDQNGFNDLMRKKWGPAVEGGDGLFYAYDGELRLAIMPVSLFCSGHTFFIQKLYEKVGLAPYAVHTTFQFAGTPGKRHRLREAKLFFDKPEYYDPAGGVIVYNPDIPEALMSGGKHSLETHFNLVIYQLKQIRNALALATILGRTLVLPALWARFDKQWFPHPGILEGSETSQPFVAPLDHVFEVHKMLDESFPEDQFGPMIPFREYSFLENPRLPESVHNSKIVIKPCERGADSCPVSPVGPDTDGSLLLPRGATQAEVEQWLLPQKETKILEFTSILEAFGEWTDKTREARFVARIKQYLGIWCCVNAHPGHIWYDFFADQKPGWTPKPPKDGSEDHPPF